MYQLGFSRGGTPWRPLRPDRRRTAAVAQGGLGWAWWLSEWLGCADDAVAAGNLSTALLLKHWADAADLLTLSVITEFSGFFAQAVRARFGGSTPSTRSVQDQILDALAVEVASCPVSIRLMAGVNQVDR